MKKTIGWGIMATGTIANKFCDGLKHLEDAEIVAVASRSLDKAQAFSRKYGIRKPMAAMKSSYVIRKWILYI
jgi:hypothetical protein